MARFESILRNNSNPTWKFKKFTILVYFEKILFSSSQKKKKKKNRVLYSNEFSGSIPTELGNLTNLYEL